MLKQTKQMNSYAVLEVRHAEVNNVEHHAECCLGQVTANLDEIDAGSVNAATMKNRSVHRGRKITPW